MKIHFSIEFINSEIEKRNMSKAKFAKECGISHVTLCKILSDNLHIRLSPVRKLADFLSVKLTDLFLTQGQD